MSIVTKKLKEISKKKAETKAKDKKKQLDKPIQVHNLYRDLIKKNNIFKDLKDLKKETEKITPHFFYNLNDNSNDYLSELKEIDFSDEFAFLDLAIPGDKNWIGCIIMADIYNRRKDDINKTEITRIGYSLDYEADKEPSDPKQSRIKPHTWFYVSYWQYEDEIASFTYCFKTYEEMMSHLIEEFIETINDKSTDFEKPIGGFFNFFKKEYGFTDSISMSFYEFIHGR